MVLRFYTKPALLHALGYNNLDNERNIAEVVSYTKGSRRSVDLVLTNIPTFQAKGNEYQYQSYCRRTEERRYTIAHPRDATIMAWPKFSNRQI